MSSPAELSSAASPQSTRFLLSRRADIGFLLFGGVAISAVLMLTKYLDLHFLYLAVTFAIVMDFPHVVHTYVRVAFDPEEYKRYGREFNTSLLFFVLLCGALVLIGQFALLVAVWVYWQPYHVIKQHDGISGLYAVKNGYKGERRWLRGALILGCAAPILYRIMDTGLGFGSYEVFGSTLAFSNMQIPTPPMPWPLVALCYGAAIVCLGAVGLQIVRGEAPPWPSLLLVGLAVTTYNIAYLTFTDLYTMILIATAMHALQYHAICWLATRGKHRDTNRDEAAPLGVRVLRTITAKGNLAIYAGTLLLLGSALAGTELLWMGVVPLVVVLHHFFMDGVIWKTRRNPRLAEYLQVRPAGAT